MDGTELISRIDTTLKAHKETRAWLASEAGLSVQQFTDWKRRNSIPAGDVCLRIARALGVSVEWLLTGHEPAPSALPEGLEKFPLLNAEHQRMVCTMIEALCTQEEQNLTVLSAGRTG